MPQRVLWRDFQQAKAIDFNLLGTHNRTYAEIVCREGIGSGQYYSGLRVTLYGPTEVRVPSGRYYTNGQTYEREETAIGGIQATTYSLYEFLPKTKKRVVAVLASGIESDRETEPRDFLIDVSSEITEPDAVPTVRSRLVVISFQGGLESDDPLPPVIQGDQLHIANIVMSPSSIESITMLTENLLPNITSNHEKLGLLSNILDSNAAVLEYLRDWLKSIEERIKDAAQLDDVFLLASNVARLGERVNIPDTYAEYAADFFVSADESDTTYTGYDARIEYGLLFPIEVSSSIDLALLNPADSLVSQSAEGLVLPRYTEEALYDTGLILYDGDDMVMAYQSQTLSTTTKKISTQVHVQGWDWNTYFSWFESTYGYDTETLNPQPPHFWDESYGGRNLNSYLHGYVYKWTPAWNRAWTFQDVDMLAIDTSSTQAITGAFIAQTFIMGRSFWATQIGLYFTDLDTTGDVTVILCQCTDAQPDLGLKLAESTVAFDNLKTYPTETLFPLEPIFLKAGERYAVVVVTSGLHRIATLNGAKVSQGDLLYGNDGHYFKVDLSKDLLLKMWGARFHQTYLNVPLQAASLAGGIDSIKVQFPGFIPEGTTLNFEMQSGGSWYATTTENTVLDSKPEILSLRATFSGTSLIMPGFKLANNAIRVSRAGLTLTHVSTLRIIGAPTDTFQVQLLTQHFDPLLHTLSVSLVEDGGTIQPSASDTVRVEGREPGEPLKRHFFSFSLPAAIDRYRLQIEATRTNANTPPFVILERIDVAI